MPTETELEQTTRLLDQIDTLHAERAHLRGQLAYLIGYYETDGAVPVELVERVLAGGTVHP